jgi:hypothetical protein
MVNEELKNYIIGLLKQGYDIDLIRNQLIKAGNNTIKIDMLTKSSFKEYNKELFDYVDSELKKNKNISEIKQDLLILDYSENNVNKVLDIYKEDKSFFERINLSELFHREKVWFNSWIKIYSIIFATIFVVMILIAVPLIANSFSRENTIGKKSYCYNLFKSENIDQSYLFLCEAFYNKDITKCDLLNNIKEPCRDAYNLYLTYKTKNNYCENIINANLRELCIGSLTSNCPSNMKMQGYCNSIVFDTPSSCENSFNNYIPFLDSCTNHYVVYSSIKSDYLEGCSKISDFNMRKICEILISS